MSFQQFCVSARTNIAGIMFNSSHLAEAVKQYLRNATVIDKALYFADPQITAVAIELVRIGEDDYCFIGEKCRLPFVPKYVADNIPKIYVACLSSYNNGRLHGMWIDATQEESDIHADIEHMLSYSPEDDAEEWRIDDYEGFCGIAISEYQSIETLVELGQLIAEHGNAYAAYVSHVGIEYATVREFEDVYQGEWDSEQDFAENLMNECHEVPKFLEYYIDYEKYVNDLFINDYYSCNAECEKTGSSRTEVYVFRRD